MRPLAGPRGRFLLVRQPAIPLDGEAAEQARQVLDKRLELGTSADCPLPELFHALRVKFPELTLPAFHDGARRLHDVRALRLAPKDEMTEPEYAVVVEGRLMYGVSR